MLPPLDNMISRDTTTFLTSQAPDYQASVFQMVQHSLTADFREKDIVSAVRLLHVVLQVRQQEAGWGTPLPLCKCGVAAETEAPDLPLLPQVCRRHVDRWIEPYIGLAMQKLAIAENSRLRDALVGVVANAIYYNPALALKVGGHKV